MTMTCSQDRRLFLFSLAATVAPPAFAQNESSAGKSPSAGLLADLVIANKILVGQGVVDAFGHVSARNDKNPERFLLSRSLAPSEVSAADIMEYDLDGAPINAQGRSSYLERFIHSAIYRARPDVGAVVHSHSANMIPFSVSDMPLRPTYHMSGFLGGAVPVFDIRKSFGNSTDMLIHNQQMGAALAKTLGNRTVVLIRGHGSVAVGANIRLAVMHAVYADAAAKVQAEAMRLGKVTYLNSAETQKTQESGDGQVERAWNSWRAQVLATQGVPN
jgi:ribulose-5-phosphate 4-epimerase/fuculose-1-phosphate aldolase